VISYVTKFVIYIIPADSQGILNAITNTNLSLPKHVRFSCRLPSCYERLHNSASFQHPQYVFIFNSQIVSAQPAQIIINVREQHTRMLISYITKFAIYIIPADSHEPFTNTKVCSTQKWCPCMAHIGHEIALVRTAHLILLVTV
jgi:hypothetical protein